MNEWNIQTRARGCQSCDKAFEDQELCHTLLVEERHQLARLDVCQKCWETQYAEGAADRKGFISHWQGEFQPPPPAPPDPIRREAAEELLRRLIAAGQPNDGPVCYILAVMLERKRLLKVKEQFQRDGARVFIYEQPATGDVFTITDPDLRLDQLDEVQHKIAQLLNPPPPAVAPTPAPADEAAVLSAPEGGAAASPPAAA